MKKERKSIKFALVGFAILFSTVILAHPINDFYKKHKNDLGMEAKMIPPKMASLLIDEDYPEAIDVLQSLSALKYLNYSGDAAKVKAYAEQACKAKGLYRNLLEQRDGDRIIKVFGSQKRGEIRKLMVIVETKTDFLLMIGKGRLTKKQIKLLPQLANEI